MRILMLSSSFCVHLVNLHDGDLASVTDVNNRVSEIANKKSPSFIIHQSNVFKHEKGTRQYCVIIFLVILEITFFQVLINNRNQVIIVERVRKWRCRYTPQKRNNFLKGKAREPKKKNWETARAEFPFIRRDTCK